MNSALKYFVIPALACLASSSAFSAVFCSHIMIDSVQITLQNEVPNTVIKPIVISKDTGLAVDLGNNGDFYLSGVLKSGDYTLSLVEGDQVLLTEDFNLHRAPACYIVPFLRSYRCSQDRDDVVSCLDAKASLEL